MLSLPSIDPKVWNEGNLEPTADRPLVFSIRGQAPSLKNERTPVVNFEKGTVTTRPNPAVHKFIQQTRGSVQRALPKGWKIIKGNQQVVLWMIVGAHAISSIPDKDADNMGTTIQEALAPPRNGRKELSEAELNRYVFLDDRQVVLPAPLRVPFPNKDFIYNLAFVWLSQGDFWSVLKEVNTFTTKLLTQRGSQ